MLVYAGVDEAGYGPLLGPLCIGCAVFVIDDHDPAQGAPNLWAALRSAVCRRRRDRRNRIAIDDSKKLKGASSGKSHPLRDLERGVLSFLAATGSLASDDTGLRDLLGTEPPVPAAPWHAGGPVRLPLAHDPGMLAITSARLRRSCERAGVRLDRLACEAIDAGPFNDRLDRSGNKANVNFDAAIRHVAAVWNRFPDAHPRVVVDRHGGRTRYREALQCAFPEAHITIVAEKDTLSRYRLTDGDRSLTISFEAEAETRHLPVALASMTAKYVRELAMHRLNRFFVEHMPELRPTAGYVQDGRRFMQDVEPLVQSLGLPRRQLVRMG